MLKTAKINFFWAGWPKQRSRFKPGKTSFYLIKIWIIVCQISLKYLKKCVYRWSKVLIYNFVSGCLLLVFTPPLPWKMVFVSLFMRLCHFYEFFMNVLPFQNWFITRSPTVVAARMLRVPAHHQWVPGVARGHWGQGQTVWGHPSQRWGRCPVGQVRHPHCE